MLIALSGREPTRGSFAHRSCGGLTLRALFRNFRRSTGDSMYLEYRSTSFAYLRLCGRNSCIARRIPRLVLQGCSYWHTINCNASPVVLARSCTSEAKRCASSAELKRPTRTRYQRPRRATSAGTTYEGTPECFSFSAKYFAPYYL